MTTPWFPSWRKWTREDDEKLIAGRKSGETVAALAEQLGRSYGSTSTRLHKLTTGQDLGKKTERTGGDSTRLVFQKHRRWTSEDDEKLLAAWSDGQSSEAIAEQLNRPHRAVGARIYTLKKRGNFNPPGGLRPRGPRTTRQKEAKIAYELRRAGKTWAQIAEITGVTKVWRETRFEIRVLTESYAKREGLPWPLAGPEDSPDSAPKIAYAMRCQGKTWQYIAEVTGVHGKTAHGMYRIARQARGYARRNSLPWPDAKSAWPDQDVQTLRDGYAQGLSDENLARLLNKTTNGVRQKRIELGLRGRRWAKRPSP